jgi:glycosyltransferase involved in cell wall biosynthesis
MRGSRHIIFNPSEGDFMKVIRNIMTDNGIDLNNVINLPPTPNTSMARIYKNTDIGLFPNRCEGGTNLVLMEYMACGKPVIASYNTGHKDILTKENSIMLENMTLQKINDGTRDLAVWETPNLDEIVSNLEWAYNNRDKIKETGDNAGEYMSNITWQRSAEEFYKVFEPYI